MPEQPLRQARINKQDEFYTQIGDIEQELRHYKGHFKDKVVFCNCDDPEYSNFWLYFVLNFDQLKLKKLVATHYDKEKPTYKLEKIRGKKDVLTTPLSQNGDFRSPECIEILKQSDIVVTNPPFSLFREYVAQLMAYHKKFIILGNLNAITYREIFPLLKDNQIWLGSCLSYIAFRVPDYYEERSTRFWIDKDGKKWRSMGNICWFTNLDIPKRHEKLILYQHYSPDKYPKYDNYDAINVDKVSDIPIDYYACMAVPVTYAGKHNPDQFDIIDANDIRTNSDTPRKGHGLIKDKDASITFNQDLTNNDCMPHAQSVSQSVSQTNYIRPYCY